MYMLRHCTNLCPIICTYVRSIHSNTDFSPYSNSFNESAYKTTYEISYKTANRTANRTAFRTTNWTAYR